VQVLDNGILYDTFENENVTRPRNNCVTACMQREIGSVSVYMLCYINCYAVS
jgi:hypothetical protein